jgi:hypothetical protein
MVFKKIEVQHIFLTNLERATVHIGLDRGNIKDSYRNLGIRRLATELVVGVPESLTDSVYTDEGSS